MRHYLVVASRTLGGEHLLDVVRERMQRGPSRFHIVVPASHPTSSVWSDGEVEAAAEERLDRALTRFRGLGAEVTGVVGDPSPVQAVGDAVLEQSFDEIILSTLPIGPSRWLRQDVVHRVQRAHEDVPVIHVVGQEAEATTA